MQSFAIANNNIQIAEKSLRSLLAEELTKLADHAEKYQQNWVLITTGLIHH